MSTNKTTNYQLHSWEPGDDFLRTEFNENFGAIDEAVAGKVELVFGYYFGNNTSSRTVILGFTPKAVLLFRSTGHTTYESDTYGGLMFSGMPLKCNGSGTYICGEVVDGGFAVTYQPGNRGYSNANGYIYYYMAVK